MMKEYNEYVVAFLDILGFKNLIYDSSFDEIMKIFRNIISEKDVGRAFTRAYNVGDRVLENYNKAVIDTKIHIMSDSIVIASPDQYPESLAVVIDLCSAIQEQLYDLDNSVFVRGAISVGEFYIGNNLAFGRGMVDAYIAQENYAIYPRIIFSDKVCEGRTVSVEENRMMPKDDEDEYYFVDSLYRYLDVYDKEYEEYKDSAKFYHILSAIEKQLNGYCDRRVREKYVWLKKALENAMNYDNKRVKAEIDSWFPNHDTN